MELVGLRGNIVSRWRLLDFVIQYFHTKEDLKFEKLLKYIASFICIKEGNGLEEELCEKVK